MVCHALGRCRICGRKHKLPIFGSEENQHALIEKERLQLIVLDTVCIECICKFEELVKRNTSIVAFRSFVPQRQGPNRYQLNSDTTSTTQRAVSEARSTKQGCETEGKLTKNIASSYENGRLTPRADSDTVPKMISHRTQNPLTDNAPETGSLSTSQNLSNKTTNIRPKRKAQSQMSCDFCEKEFTHSGDLKRHKRKHTGEKPYECLECHKTFSQLSNLARHRFVHSGERPFVCADCGQSYSRKGRLVNHIERQLCRRKRCIATNLAKMKMLRE